MARKKFQLPREDYTVLIVDDQLEVLESVTPLLKREGYRVICNQSGREALETVKKERVDLMLLDYFMPGMTGEEVVKEIRKFDREMFILLQTGYAGDKPPLEMLKILDIQGYHDKTEGPDKLLLWVAAGIRSCAQMRINKHMREGLACILNSVPHIFRVQAFKELLKDILGHIKGLTEFESGFLILEELNSSGAIGCGIGRFEGLSHEQILQESIKHELIEQARDNSDIVHYDNTLVLPILEEEHWTGVIYLENCILDKEEYLDLLKIYVNQSVEAIINIQLHEEVVSANERLQDSYSQLQRTYYELIEALTKAVDAKDAYTAGHSTRVSLYARVIGKSMGMPHKDLVKLKVEALFHDIGKIGIPDNVLLKEGKLTDEEYAIIKTHPVTGSKILSPVSMLANIIPGVKHHHERYDGRGYPEGLAGQAIPLNARILAIADAFDAMTTDRSYRRKMSFEAALDEVERCAGTQFDPEIARHFLNRFKDNDYLARLISFWDHIHDFGRKKKLDKSQGTTSEESAKHCAAAMEEDDLSKV